MQYTIPKGVFDILPQDPDAEYSWRNSDRWQYIEMVIRNTCATYGYKEIRTPIFERTELFIRGVGEGSDIVSKEMYTFIDKGERSMTLRPEGTASLMRAFVENKLYTQPTLHKYFYIGPMFRYERPQAGRYRQHHQFGAEALGIDKPEQDVELIDLVCTLYKKLGLKNLKVMINSVGNSEARTNFKNSLKVFLEPKFDQLSEDSKIRFHKNILRILDSKDPNDQKLLEGAPSILDSLNSTDALHFETVCLLLTKLGINFTVNPRLVRGLDYYNKTVFEIASYDLGAQNSLGGGGRYDGLTETIGGPHIPSAGFGTGLERVLQAMDKQQVHFPSPPHPILFLIPMGEAAKQFCFELICSLRHQMIPCEMDLSGKKMQNGLQMANHVNAEYCMVIGDQELESQKSELKNLATRQSVEVLFSELPERIKELHPS
ncbi:MAG: histidine--tRNA ligase [Chlamydiae bacterium]|nr:histidine--tRNA ligase [Chlamydiota bacterium]